MQLLFNYNMDRDIQKRGRPDYHTRGRESLLLINSCYAALSMPLQYDVSAGLGIIGKEKIGFEGGASFVDASDFVVPKHLAVANASDKRVITGGRSFIAATLITNGTLSKVAGANGYDLRAGDNVGSRAMCRRLRVDALERFAKALEPASQGAQGFTAAEVNEAKALLRRAQALLQRHYRDGASLTEHWQRWLGETMTEDDEVVMISEPDSLLQLAIARRVKATLIVVTIDPAGKQADVEYINQRKGQRFVCIERFGSGYRLAECDGDQGLVRFVGQTIGKQQRGYDFLRTMSAIDKFPAPIKRPHAKDRDEIDKAEEALFVVLKAEIKLDPKADSGSSKSFENFLVQWTKRVHEVALKRIQGDESLAPIRM